MKSPSDLVAQSVLDIAKKNSTRRSLISKGAVAIVGALGGGALLSKDAGAVTPMWATAYQAKIRSQPNTWSTSKWSLLCGEDVVYVLTTYGEQIARGCPNYEGSTSTWYRVRYYTNEGTLIEGYMSSTVVSFSPRNCC